MILFDLTPADATEFGKNLQLTEPMTIEPYDKTRHYTVADYKLYDSPISAFIDSTHVPKELQLTIQFNTASWVDLFKPFRDPAEYSWKFRRTLDPIEKMEMKQNMPASYTVFVHLNDYLMHWQRASDMPVPRDKWDKYEEITDSYCNYFYRSCERWDRGQLPSPLWQYIIDHRERIDELGAILQKTPMIILDYSSYIREWHEEFERMKRAMKAGKPVASALPHLTQKYGQGKPGIAVCKLNTGGEVIIVNTRLRMHR